MNSVPRVCVDTLALAHGVRSGVRQSFLEEANVAAKRCGTELIWPVLMDGFLVTDLDAEAFDRLCQRSDFRKIGAAGVGLANVRSLTGGLTAAASLAVGEMLGADVVVTGGLGGIHRGRLNDQSADLYALSVSRLPLVCSGFKPFIDAEASIAVLDASSVPIFHCDDGGWPCLYANDPNLCFGEKVDSIEEVAAALNGQQQLARSCRSCLCVLSVPQDAALSSIEVEACCSSVMEKACLDSVLGSDLTPWLIKAMRQLLGKSLDIANEAALMNNIVASAVLANKLVSTEIH